MLLRWGGDHFEPLTTSFTVAWTVRPGHPMNDINVTKNLGFILDRDREFSSVSIRDVRLEWSKTYIEIIH